jgi:hypothetical protein
MTGTLQKTLTPFGFQTFSSAQPNRFSHGLWSLRKATADENAVFHVPIIPEVLTNNGHGFEMTSYDVIYGVSGQALAGTPTDNLVTKKFVNAALPTITNTAVGGSAYQTAINTVLGQTYVIHRTITTPAFINTADTSMALELVFPCNIGTILDIYGVNIYFTQTT